MYQGSGYADSGSISKADKLVGLLVPVFGILDACAIINLGDTTGVPLATAALPLLLWRIVANWSAVKFAWRNQPGLDKSTRLIAIFLICLWIGGAIHALGFGVNPQVQLVQCIARTTWPTYFTMSIIFYRAAKAEYVFFKALLCLGCVYVLYGFYDISAQIYGLPHFLEFVRNNHSTYVSTAVTGGWIGLPRISSLAAEPSLTSTPIMIFFATCAIMLTGWRRNTGFLLLIIFTIGTAARSLWLVAAISVIGTMGAKLAEYFSSDLNRARWSKASLAAGCFLLPILLLSIRLSVPSDDKDFSIQERQEATRAGFELFQSNPVVGLGFEAKNVYYRNYADRLSNFTTTPTVIHNGLAAYISSLGVIGFLMFEIPFLLIVIDGNLSFRWKVYWLSVMLMLLQIGDLTYQSSFWVVLIFATLQTKVVLERRERTTVC